MTALLILLYVLVALSISLKLTALILLIQSSYKLFTTIDDDSQDEK